MSQRIRVNATRRNLSIQQERFGLGFCNLAEVYIRFDGFVNRFGLEGWKSGRLEEGKGLSFQMRRDLGDLAIYSRSGLVPAVGNIDRCSLLDPALHRYSRHSVFSNRPLRSPFDQHTAVWIMTVSGQN